MYVAWGKQLLLQWATSVGHSGVETVGDKNRGIKV